jgi:hypothetical protein
MRSDGLGPSDRNPFMAWSISIRRDIRQMEISDSYLQIIFPKILFPPLSSFGIHN